MLRRTAIWAPDIEVIAAGKTRVHVTTYNACSDDMSDRRIQTEMRQEQTCVSKTWGESVEFME